MISKRPHPIPFDKFASSEIFTIRADLWNFVDKEGTEILPLLLTHAKLYIFAALFNISTLRELSRKKIIALTPYFGELENRTHGLAMISLMQYVLENIPVASGEAPDELVKFLAGYAGFLVDRIGGYPEFHAVLASSAREDFFRVFCRWVRKGRDDPPWGGSGREKVVAVDAPIAKLEKAAAE